MIIYPPGGDIDNLFDTSGAMMQPGGGIDFRVTDWFAIRGQFDYQWFRVGEESTDTSIRFVVAGVVYLARH